MSGSRLTLTLPARFDLKRAVCSYGYYMLAPNRWDGEACALEHVLRDAQGRPMTVRITQRGRRLKVACARALSAAEQREVKRCVARMLRLDEDFTAWHRLLPEARRAGFDRLFRSATLFEDIVKTITGCNVAWPNTVRMNALLCAQHGEGAFPTPAQLARVKADRLKRTCKVGYRAERIVRLARDVDAGRLDLGAFEQPGRTTDELHAALCEIHGIGDYAAANICSLLGRYDRLAIDSETYRHFREVYGAATPDDPKKLHAKIIAHYDRYAPYQQLAYWYELWHRSSLSGGVFGDAQAAAK